MKDMRLASISCWLVALLATSPASAQTSEHGDVLTVSGIIVGQHATSPVRIGTFEPQADSATAMANPARIFILKSNTVPKVTVLGHLNAMPVTVSKAANALGRPIDVLKARDFNRTTRSRLALQSPLKTRFLTSNFGHRLHPMTGRQHWHSGIDLGAPMGTPIAAANDGIVSFASPSGGYGLLVSLDHGGGLQTRYGHMSKLNVTAGQAVGKGDIIGYVGSTGRSTGPHLHYEVRINGQAVNPLATRSPKRHP